MTYSQRYYWIRFVYVLSVSFTNTSFIPYLESRGLSRPEIHIAYAIFNIGVMLLEVPVSAIGEWIGPKRSFLIGCLCKCAAAAAFFLGHDLIHFYGAEIISALAIAFISGSLDAWLMDRFNEEGNIGDLGTSRVFMIGSRIGKVALALGGVSGAYLANWNTGYPWIMVGVGFLVTFFWAMALLSGHEYRAAWKTEKVYFKWHWDNILYGYRIALNNRVLAVLLVDGFLVSLAQSSPKMFWLPYLMNYFGKDMFFVGNIWLCLAATQFLGTFGMPWMLRWTGSPLRLKLVFSVFSVVALSSVIWFQANIVGFIVLYLVWEWSKPYHDALDLTLTHAETRHAGENRKGRLTFMSLGNLVSKLGTALGLIVIGWLSQYGITEAWTAGVLLYSLVIPCYSCLVREEGQKKFALSVEAN